MDIVDGTDLLLRSLSNWCSAVIYFYPPEQHIIASFVADSDGNLFFASDLSNSSSYFLRAGAKKAVPLELRHSPANLEDAVINFVLGRPSGPLTTRPSMSDAAIAYYGQKPPHFLSPYSTALRTAMEQYAERIQRNERPGPASRIYNLGGNPMIVRVANGMMDAVFDLERPKAHDIVAGAYIALKAGAVLGDLENHTISEERLAEYLLKPNDPGPAYIAAGTPTVYEELQAALARPHSIASQHSF